MAELLSLSIDVIKRIATNGAPALVEYAAANGLTPEAVRLAVLRATRDKANDALRGYAHTAASKTSKSAVSKAVKQAAKKAAETAVRASVAETAGANRLMPRLAQGVFRLGTQAARFYIPQILLLTLLAGGLYILWNQAVDMASDDDVRPGWRMRVEENDPERKDDQGNTPITPVKDDNDHSVSRSKGGSQEMWRRGWAGSGRRVVAKSRGAILSLSIAESVDGMSGQVTFYDTNEQQKQASVDVQESSNGYRVSYQTDSGSVKGDLRIDEESGYLIGTLVMPEAFGGIVDVSLIPQF